MNRLSHILTAFQGGDVNRKLVSKSQKLFSDLGLVYINDGISSLMPMLVKSLRKLENIVHKTMKEIPAHEIKLPVLTSSQLLKTTGRLNLPNLYKVDTTNNKSYILSPTCEETMAHLLKNHKVLCHFHLPLSYYQISTKFRNEMRPRSGLLRTKEFVMKELYIFDSNDESSEQNYKKVRELYDQFFKILKIPYYYVEGSTGDIGGLKSHEYHFLSDAGQDKIVLCQNCGHNENLELQKFDVSKCSKCQSTNIKIETGIEIGHTFKLGTVFTKPFNVQYLNKQNIKEIIHMSSYGLGLTRILAASVEVLCQPDKIKWPFAIAPYLVCLVPPKAGSKEEKAGKNLTDVLYHNLNQSLEDEIIIDDRTSLTIGNRLQLLKKIGFPLIVVLGKNLLDDPPAVEIIDSVTDSVDHIQVPDIHKFILDKKLLFQG